MFLSEQNNAGQPRCRGIGATLLLLLLLLFSLLSCVQSGDDRAENEGGSGSEIVGTAQYSDTAVAMAKPARGMGLPVIGGGVFLFRSNFQADIMKDPGSYIPDVITGSDGGFRIGYAAPGNYILEVSDYNGKAVAAGFRVDGSGAPVDLGTLLAGKTASLRYTLSANLGSGVTLEYAVYILGTRISTRGDNDKLVFQMDGVPAGPSYSVKIQVSEPVSWSNTYTGIRFVPGGVYDLNITLPDFQ